MEANELMREDLQPFSVGDWQARQNRSVKTERSVVDTTINYERQYLIFQQYLTQEDFTPIFQQCERSCIELDRLIRLGNNAEATQAQELLNAYGLAMQLATELLALKNKLKSTY
jgi:hypothetical protein